jgi:omega-amidase
MKDLRITLVQTKLHWHKPELNLPMFDALLTQVKKSSTDIILLPEMFSTGFSMQAAALAEEMDGYAVTWMKKTAKQKNAILCGSLIIKEKNKFYNRLIWMNPDGTYLVYDKRHLFRMAHEEKTYAAGKKKIIVDCKGWKICPLVCYDLRFPVWSRRTEKENYDLLIYVANWPERRKHAWKQLLVARAIENQSYVAGLNRIGKDGNKINYTGDTAVIDPLGKKISFTKASMTSVETVTLSAKVLQGWREQMKTWMDADRFSLQK